MPHKVYINGKMVSEETASVSVFDRSYLYGEGAFETIRAYNGRPAFCDMHYHRLTTTCEKIKIELPVDEYAFEHAIIKTINANKLKEAYVRVMVSPVGLSTGIARPSKLTTNFVIITKSFKGRPEAVYEKGIKIIVVNSIYADSPEMSEIKSTNYLTKMIARMEVSENKADEGILQSRVGLVLEGTSTNLFIARKGNIFTPPLSDGCLPGITRFVVMGLAENMGISCRETHLTLTDVKGADEIFLTGTTSEVLPVEEVVGFVKKDAPGPVTKKIMSAYSSLVRSFKF